MRSLATPTCSAACLEAARCIGGGKRLKRTSACLQKGEKLLHVQATSYLVTAWEALAAQQETTMEDLPVSFEDVSIVQAVQAQPGEAVTLSVLLDRSHRFQVCSVTPASSMLRLLAPYGLSHARDEGRPPLAAARVQHMSAEVIWRILCSDQAIRFRGQDMKECLCLHRCCKRLTSLQKAASRHAMHH